MKQVRLYIIDEHPLVCQALAARLAVEPALEVVGSASNLAAGLEEMRRLRPQVVLLGSKSDRRGETERAIRAICHLLAGKTPGIIVLSAYLDEPERDQVLQAGAQRYLLKDIGTARLVREIEVVAETERLLLSQMEGRTMKQQLVKDWMTPNPVTIRPDTTLPQAHRLMREYGIRRLPVVSEEGVAGIVTLGDVRGAEPSGATSLSIWELNYLIGRLRVEEIMTPRPFTIREDATVAEAANLMLRYKISGLPVMDERSRLVGIITESDIFRMLVKTWQEEDEPSLASA